MNFLTKYFDLTLKTTLYPELKVQLFVHNLNELFDHAFLVKKWSTFNLASNFFTHRAKRWSRREYPCSRPHPAAISVQLLPCEWTCIADGRPSQRRRSRDFPLNVQHPLHHDGDTQRGFSWVRLTLRDFTFPLIHHVQTLSKKPLDLPAVSVFFCVFLLTGLTP